MALRFGDFATPVADPPNAAEENGARGDDVGQQFQNAPGGFGEGFVGNAGPQADLVEGDGGQVEDRRSADFGDAVDLLVVLLGFFGEALAGFGDQSVAVPGFSGAHRAGFGTGGHF